MLGIIVANVEHAESATHSWAMAASATGTTSAVPHAAAMRPASAGASSSAARTLTSS